MPYTWLGFSTATKPFVAGKAPLHSRTRSTALSGRNAAQELYFDVSKDVAYALFKDLGGLDRHEAREPGELGGVNT